MTFDQLQQVGDVQQKKDRSYTSISRHMPYLSASAVVIHYEEALYHVYAPLPFSIEFL